jgi:hypothetical protein
MNQLNPVVLEETTKEVTGKEPESPLEERREHTNLFSRISSLAAGHHCSTA